MTDKEAMKLALEALEDFGNHDNACPQWPTYSEPEKYPKCNCGYDDAITALKERLAQEKALQTLHNENERLGLYRDAYTEQEPVGYVYSESGVKSAAIQRNLPNGTPLYTHPPQRTEPDDIASMIACRDMLDAQPVPPRRTWADLSDEDIEECFTVTPDLYLKRHIAQRISDKLKEKNT